MTSVRHFVEQVGSTIKLIDRLESILSVEREQLRVHKLFDTFEKSEHNLIFKMKHGELDRLRDLVNQVDLSAKDRIKFLRTRNADAMIRKNVKDIKGLCKSLLNSIESETDKETLKASYQSTENYLYNCRWPDSADLPQIYDFLIVLYKDIYIPTLLDEVRTEIEKSGSIATPTTVDLKENQCWLIKNPGALSLWRGKIVQVEGNAVRIKPAAYSFKETWYRISDLTFVQQVEDLE